LVIFQFKKILVLSLAYPSTRRLRGNRQGIAAQKYRKHDHQRLTMIMHPEITHHSAGQPGSAGQPA
jgi:hypothetical protein